MCKKWEMLHQEMLHQASSCSSRHEFPGCITCASCKLVPAMKQAFLQLIPMPSASSRTCRYQFAHSTRQTPLLGCLGDRQRTLTHFLGLERQTAVKVGYAVFRNLELAVNISALVLTWTAQQQSQSQVLQLSLLPPCTLGCWRQQKAQCQLQSGV